MSRVGVVDDIMANQTTNRCRVTPTQNLCRALLPTLQLYNSSISIPSSSCKITGTKTCHHDTKDLIYLILFNINLIRYQHHFSTTAAEHEASGRRPATKTRSERTKSLVLPHVVRYSYPNHVITKLKPEIGGTTSNKSENNIPIPPPRTSSSHLLPQLRQSAQSPCSNKPSQELTQRAHSLRSQLPRVGALARNAFGTESQISVSE